MVFPIITLLLILIAAFAFGSTLLNQNKKENGPFYVGVTFCGNTTQEAMLLVDKVKNYTNLFVLQSGPLMKNTTAVIEIGDYAISNGLHFAAYFNTQAPPQMATWIGIAEQQWGNMFAGLYYGDEPGGVMLDGHVDFETKQSATTNKTGDVISLETVAKDAGGTVTLSRPGTNIIYRHGGVISVSKYDFQTINPQAGPVLLGNLTEYYPNGTITFRETGGDSFTMENGSSRIALLETYDEVLAEHPFPNQDAAAEALVGLSKSKLQHLTKQWLSNQSFPIFTSDYALYWFDYMSGYDLVLAQLGWNNTVAQEIGLVRGAANMQSKDWGVIITWTYTHPPYLAGGDIIFNQMRSAYESGADYIVVFNYAEGMTSPYGILKDEHFEALHRFWNEVVQNPAVVHGGIKAEAAFVLPRNYGWGLRNPQDTVWGLWSPSEQAPQTWGLLQDALDRHGLRLDIVYEDPTFAVAGKYGKIIYWNQTAPSD